MSSRDRRVIIALDLDNFYVGCERLRDPSLIGKSVGIKQKGILATCSYEAREKGVDKLMPIKEALKHCPELAIVSGEDLTLYRAYSRRVFELARSLFGEPVEKLGMDELFCDITPLVAAHRSEVFAGQARRRQLSDGEIELWFSFKGVGKGFWYQPGTWAGHVVLDSLPRARFERWEHLQIGSHVALYLRTQVHEQIGLTSSAGVSFSKTLSKLIAATHKPADQTSFPGSPPPHPSPNPSASQPSTAIQAFLDPLDLRKLPGFGSVVLQKLLAFHSATPLPPLQPHHQGPLERLTILEARTLFSLADLERIFSPRLGAIFWGLLHGVDDDSVKPSPEFPAQISVEDSYAADPGFNLPRLKGELRRHTRSLLRRLENELTIDAVSSSSAASRRWVRWPQQVRLSVRKAWDSPHGRESKSAPLPGWALDLGTPVEARADRLVFGQSSEKDGASITASQGLVGVLGTLLKSLLSGAREWEKGITLYIINVAATSMSTEPPPPSLDSWTRLSTSSSSANVLKHPSQSSSSLTHKGKQRAHVDLSFLNIDLAVLAELPADLRAEVLDSYGITEDDLNSGDAGTARPEKRQRLEETAGLPFVVVDLFEAEEESLRADEPADEDDTTPVSLGDEDPLTEWASDGEGGALETFQCSRCGAQLFEFSLQAHAAFHEGVGEGDG